TAKWPRFLRKWTQHTLYTRDDERVTQTHGCDGDGTVRRRDCQKNMEAFFTQRGFRAFSRHHVLRSTSGFLRSIGMTMARAVSAACTVWCCSARQTIARPEFDPHFGDFGKNEGLTVKEQ
ncbi:unnamed protein product, partial [Ectocarpus sp. 4 AP-2014]